MHTGIKASMRAAWVVAFALVMSSCWTYTTGTNKVVTGNLAYVYFRRVATDNVVDQLHYGLHRGDPRDTLPAMEAFAMSSLFRNRLASVGFSVSGFRYFFHRDNEGDFAEAAWRVNGTRRCLVMHRNVNPWGDRHNWTYRNASDGHCTHGQGFV